MSDDAASPLLATTLDPGVAMPTSRKHKHAPRNAKPKAKHAPQRYRNAGPPGSRSSVLRGAASAVGGSVRRSISAGPEGPTMTDKLVHLTETLAGAAAASFLGAYAVKWGFHPEMVSYVLGGAGIISATRKREIVRAIGLGAASASGSQLVLLKLNPPPAAPKIAVQPQLPQPTQTAALPKPKNADLGSLPPGMLDAAFERARTELAVSGDGYPYSYEHMPHHFRHGPVYPGG